MEPSKKQPYLILIAIIISGLMIAGAIAYKGGFGNSDQKATPKDKTLNKKEEENKDKENQTESKDINIAGEGDDPMLGNPDAPLTMVIFGDFQCHYCRKLELEIKPIIIEKYVKTGKLKIIARDFPFLGKESVLAAVAGNCALEQNKYFEYSDALHGGQDTNEIPEVNSGTLKLAAKNLKLNTGQFDECLDSNKYLDEVEKDFKEGRALKIEGTPTTFINKEIIEGAQPFEEFEKIIESMIN